MVGLAVLASLAAPGHGQDGGVDPAEATRLNQVARLLSEGTWYERSEAADALQSAGKRAAAVAPVVLATAIRAIGAHDWRLAHLTMDTLAAISTQQLSECCGALDTVLGGSDLDAKLQVLRLATDMGRAGAPLGNHLVQLAQENDLGLPALRTLVAVGATADAVPLLKRAVASSDADTVRLAIAGFGEVGTRSRETLPMLTALLGNANYRSAALAALAGIGHDAAPAVPALVQAELAQPPQDRGEYVATLRAIETEDIAPSCADATVTCVEGAAVRCELQAADPDDAPGELTIAAAAKPAHGSLAIQGLTAIYSAPYGWTGSERIAIKVSDRAGKSGSATLTLTVAPDEAAPALRDMWMLEMDHTVLRLVFNKPLQKASAETAQSYAISPSVQVTAASLGTDQSTVDLKVAGLRADQPYTLSVQRVLDAAATPVAFTCAGQAFTPTALKPGLHVQFYSPEDFKTEANAGVALTVDYPDGPKPNTEHYAARYSGWLVPDADASYTLQLTSDDGSRLWLDDQQLIDNWGDHGATDASAHVDLVHGRRYKLRVDFYNNQGPSCLLLQWSRPGMEMAPIPAKVLSHGP